MQRYIWNAIIDLRELPPRMTHKLAKALTNDILNYINKCVKGYGRPIINTKHMLIAIAGSNHSSRII